MIPDNLTISQALRWWSHKTPNSIFCRDLDGNSLTFFDANELVDQFASYLVSLGVVNNTTISLRMSNSIIFIISFLGVVRSGAVASPCPEMMTDEEFNKIAELTNTHILFTNSKSSSIDIVNKIKIITFSTFQNFIKTVKQYEKFEKDHDSIVETSFLFLSSGTSSELPKAIMHNSLVLTYTAQLFSKRLGFNCSTRHLAFLPCGNTSFIGHSLLPSVISGGTIVVARNYLSISRKMWDIVDQYDISFIQVVPAIAKAIYNSFDDKAKNIISKSRLSYLSCGSAPLSEKLQDNFLAKTGKFLLNTYGLSETGAFFFNDLNSKNFMYHSIGTPLNVSKCALFDSESGEEIHGPGSGELYVASPTLFIGYLNEDSGKKNLFKGDLFKTGDILTRDIFGNYFYNTRVDSLIVRAGVNISPLEIEQSLLVAKGVEDVVVLGVPNNLFGVEIVCCYTTINNNSYSKEIKQHAEKYLSIVKRPSKYIHLKKFAKTTSGKVKKLELVNYVHKYLNNEEKEE